MDFKNLDLTEEQTKQVKEIINTEYVAKSKHDEILSAKEKLEIGLAERDKQLKELNKSIGNEADLKTMIENYQKANEELKQQLKQNEINYALERALTKAGAKNIKAVKALLNIEKAELEGGELKGINEQIENLKKAEDSSFLFELKNTETPKFVGVAPSEGSGKPAMLDPSNMKYDDFCKYVENNTNFEF